MFVVRLWGLRELGYAFERYVRHFHEVSGWKPAVARGGGRARRSQEAVGSLAAHFVGRIFHLFGKERWHCRAGLGSRPQGIRSARTVSVVSPIRIGFRALADGFAPWGFKMSITLGLILFALVSFILVVPVILDWSFVPEIDEDELGQPEFSVVALNMAMGGGRPALKPALTVVPSNGKRKLAVIRQMPYHPTAEARIR